MKTVLHKADTRGHQNHGWLDAHHSFSFANYYDPERINFGALRVLNDDVIEPGKGFGRHPHDNMEIITIPLKGKLLHKDSMGNEEYLKTGEVQVMSAGTGIFHEEYNGSNTEQINLLQIWIIPNKSHITPTYNQREFDSEEALSNWQLLVSPQNDGTLTIQQNAYISRTFLQEGDSIEYIMNDDKNASYLFVIEGEVNLNSLVLNKRDALGISETKNFSAHALKDSYILNIEIPK